MGSSSKKHKSDREHRHKHRRRSSSRSRNKEHQSKKRRDKDESKKSSHKHDISSSERKETPFNSGSSGGAASTAGNNNNNNTSGSNSNTCSLSIEEANRLRIKLGMRPLDVSGSGSGAASAGGEDIGTTETVAKKSEDVHVPAVNLGEMKRTNKIREKTELLREKRKIYDKFSKIKTLGDGADDDDVKKWIEKSRKLEHDREMAEKTAKMLDQMDEDFGIGSLMEEEFNKDKKKKNYSSRDLKGFKVEHNLDSFKEGSTVILTLKDNQVLTEDQDVLVNPRLHEDEVAIKNNEIKKKKPEYTPYDDEEFTDDFQPQKEAMLSKYDEEIYGKKITSFELGSGGKYVPSAERDLERIRKELKQQSQNLVQLSTLAREYYTNEEVESAKFNKVKKVKRKIRKKILKPDDLLNMPDEVGDARNGNDLGNRKMKIKTENPTEDGKESVSPRIEVEDMDIDQQQPEETTILGHDDSDIYNSYVVDEDDAMNELYSTLDKVRKLKQRRERTVPDEIAKTLHHTQSLGSNAFDSEMKKSDIILNATSEFCRALGDIPTYGLAGNRDEERDAFLDLELELMERKKKIQDEEDLSSQWNEVDIDTKPVNIVKEENAVLDEEPAINMGLAAALQVAQKKGYLENQSKRMPSGPKHSGLEAIHYSIEDKRYDDLDEKYRKRDRYTGMLVDFKEKEGYKPDVRLEYADDSGRLLNEKEAFRQLSHRFHGKGPGKKKTEKRMKKLEEEQLMKQMSSTDTPLNTLTLLQEKQKQERTPYVILSGNKGMSANTIVK
ncbi:U4/U6.U5 tri-snRNP-associated protein 1 [Octopus bimaculoides]|uniref:U4/U6.U5 tri-snRNP-associated protein 1 n=1 Tax=Octopus bimaculoides TaxID=37653 RepID=A0A0L8FZ76_OCTBM|nr:U4/U6.U5 tri-snRNP-associated protein 1 [Octopus bimaculoides]|eukprot:XP_014785654.1 PREDICTED: U4/U6.U5 tri-snRNP-associated protein 1-like [Octopus bimaculoides]